jgi:DNA-binding NtrC family response regulator
MGLLAAYHWPGNVRELANVIERGVVVCAGEQIGPEDLALPGAGAAPPGPAAQASPVEAPGEFHRQVKAYKEALLQAALRQAAGNQTRAAELLGINRTYLVKLLRDLKMRDKATL